MGVDRMMAKKSSIHRIWMRRKKSPVSFSNPIARDLFYGQFHRRRIAFPIDIYVVYVSKSHTYLPTSYTHSHTPHTSIPCIISLYQLEFEEFTLNSLNDRFKIWNILYDVYIHIPSHTGMGKIYLLKISIAMLDILVCEVFWYYS